MPLSTRLVFSYFYTPPPPSIHPLSLHDALPIFFSSLDASGTHWNSKSTPLCSFRAVMIGPEASGVVGVCSIDIQVSVRSEEHTSELKSRGHLVCRILLDKK